MEQVLKKIQELYSALTQAMGLVNQQRANNDKRAVELATQEKAQSEKQVELDKRENEVKKIENLRDLYDNGLKLKEENKVGTEALAEEKEKIKKYAKEQSGIINKKLNDIIAENKKITAQWDLINKEWAALKKEKAEYKDRILNELKGAVS